MSEVPSEYKYTYEKVPPRGEDWKIRRESERKEPDRQSEQSIFGERLVKAWALAKDAQKMIGTDANELTSYWKHEWEMVHQDMKKLATNNTSEFWILVADYLDTVDDRKSFREQINLPVDPKHLDQNFNGSAVLSIELIRNLEKGEVTMPVDHLVAMLELHANQVREKTERRTPMILKRVQEARRMITEAATNGKLPISEDLIDERCDNLTVVVMDGMGADLGEEWGDYSNALNQIRISFNVPYANEKDTVIHEVVHAVSGKIEQLLGVQGFEFTPRGVHIKSGIKFRQGFTWLNEGLTEQITTELTDTNTNGYVQERAMLAHMIELGVPKGLLYEAYFENYEEKSAGEHRLPKIKELFSVTNSKFGEGFLVKLDRFISAESVSSALKTWKELGTEFPRFLNLWAEGETGGQNQ